MIMTAGTNRNSGKGTLMKLRSMVMCLCVLTLLAVGFGQLQASSIPGLFNTGVSASGTPLSDGTLNDPHYALVSVPGGTTTTLIRTSAGGFPIPPYIGDDSLSAWIGPNNNQSLDGPVGIYDYRITFNLTGFMSSSAVITGGWSSDNDGVAILLNGVNTGNAPTSFTQFSIGFAPFSISTGFLPGINTLDFIVNNGATTANPTGLRVEMTGTATPTPEPGSLVLLGTGLAGFAGVIRRKLNR
jgi:hypothetical protein